MNQNRLDIEQRKSALETQARQSQGFAPQPPQVPHQWNNQGNQGGPSGHWGGQGSGNFGGPGPGGYQERLQENMPPRGPRNQGPRFDHPQQLPQGNRFDNSQRMRGPGPGPRYDEPQRRPDASYDGSQEAEDDYNDYESFGNMRDDDEQNYEDNFENREQFGSQPPAVRGGNFAGPRGPRGGPGPRFGGQAPRFEGPGGGFSGPRPGGPVPLMALNIEKPRSLEQSRSFEQFRGEDDHPPFHSGNKDDNVKPAGKPIVHGDEELLSKMGLPTSFGGPIMDEDDDENQEGRPRQSNFGRHMAGGGRDRGGGRGDFHRGRNTHGRPMNRQGSQEDGSFGPRGQFGGPLGPRLPVRPLLIDPESFGYKQPPGSDSEEPWNDNREDAKWNMTKGEDALPMDPARQRTSQKPGTDPSKVRKYAFYDTRF